VAWLVSLALVVGLVLAVPAASVTMAAAPQDPNRRLAGSQGAPETHRSAPARSSL